MTNILSNIKKTHTSFNNAVFKLLNQYKNPKVCFPNEEAITNHILNLILNKSPSGQVRFFRKEGIEHQTGTDFVLVIQGLYNGKKREFKILYQAKTCDWNINTPFLKLDLRPKKINVYNLKDLEEFDLSNYRVLLIDEFNETLLDEPHELQQYQHEAQINFGKLINAETIFILYRHLYGFNNDKKKSVGFINTKNLKTIFDNKNQSRAKTTSILNDSDFGSALYFADTYNEKIKSYLKILKNNKGFFFWDLSFEQFYESYLDWINAYNSNLNDNNFFLKLSPVSLSTQNSSFDMVKINPENNEVFQSHNLYKDQDDSIFRLTFKEDIAGKEPVFYGNVLYVNLD